MIDRDARNRYAELLRHFAAGRMTNDAYEDEFDAIETRDPSIHQVHGAVWGLYSDVTTHRLTGRHRLPAFLRQTVAVWIVFLHTDIRCAAMPPMTCRGVGAGLLALLRHIALFVPLAPVVLAGVIIDVARRVRDSCTGERERDPLLRDAETLAFWPFPNEASFRAAVRRPRLLAGVRRG